MSTTLALLKSSISNEWYTPAEHISLVREVMGGIDLDPATTPLANEVVAATYTLTSENGDLSWLPVESGGFQWFGRVFCNPPYGGLAGKFAKKMIAEYESKRTTAGILCISGYAYETRWFQALWDYPICFVRGRVKFRQPIEVSSKYTGEFNGEFSGKFHTAAATVGTAYVYLGTDNKVFHDVFSTIGAVR